MKVSSLHSAVAAGRLDIVQILLAHGANPNSKAAQDFRPIHEASARGNLEFVQLLLDNGAEINARAVDGKTPLAFALEHKKDAIASFLKALGATL
jgi:ankyrin repeat protein